MRRGRWRRAAPVAALVGVLAGCSSTVSVPAAPDGADPACARVLTALPDEVAGRSSRPTTSQGSAAWGDPPVVLRCGVARPGPSSTCVAIEGADGVSVDWVERSAGRGRVTYLTYGRVPAIALTMPRSLVSAAPLDVAAAVALTSRRARCTS